MKHIIAAMVFALGLAAEGTSVSYAEDQLCPQFCRWKRTRNQCVAMNHERLHLCDCIAEPASDTACDQDTADLYRGWLEDYRVKANEHGSHATCLINLAGSSDAEAQCAVLLCKGEDNVPHCVLEYHRAQE